MPQGEHPLLSLVEVGQDLPMWGRLWSACPQTWGICRGTGSFTFHWTHATRVPDSRLQPQLPWGLLRVWVTSTGQVENHWAPMFHSPLACPISSLFPSMDLGPCAKASAGSKGRRQCCGSTRSYQMQGLLQARSRPYRSMHISWL